MRNFILENEQDVLRALPVFLNAITATGRATFYNERGDQLILEELAHQQLLDADRTVYTAAALLPGALDRVRQRMVFNLLRRPHPGDDAPGLSADKEYLVLRQTVAALPYPRQLQLFERLRQARVNNSRTQRLILQSILGGRDFEWHAVKYREKMRRALRHAWGERLTSILRAILAKLPQDSLAFTRNWTPKEALIIEKRVERYIERPELADFVRGLRILSFVLGNEVSDDSLPLIRAYFAARTDLAAGRNLPPEVLEGIRSRYHPDVSPETALALASENLSSGQRVMWQRRADAAGVEVNIDPPVHESPARLYVYALETGELTSALGEALQAKAAAAARRLRLNFERVGVLVDMSFSMRGHDTQRWRPAAAALAMRDLLVAAAERASVVYAGDPEGEDVIRTAGATDLAGPLLKLLSDKPEAVFVLSDGYENQPAGRFDATVAEVRRIGVQTPIYQVTSVAASETAGTRPLSPLVPILTAGDKPEAMIGRVLLDQIRLDVNRGLALLFQLTLGEIIPLEDKHERFSYLPLPQPA